MLSSAYTAQKNFRAESGSYYSNLWVIGFEPVGKVSYRVGFGTDGVLPIDLPGYTSSPLKSANNRSTLFLCGLSYPDGQSQDCWQHQETTASLLGRGTFVTTNTFLMLGRIREDVLGGDSEDRWSINQRKELIHLINGTL